MLLGLPLCKEKFRYSSVLSFFKIYKKPEYQLAVCLISAERCVLSLIDWVKASICACDELSNNKNQQNGLIVKPAPYLIVTSFGNLLCYTSKILFFQSDNQP